MFINTQIIQEIYTSPPKKSLQKFGFEFFLELAELFRLNLDQDQKMSEAIVEILHSMPGKALYKAFFFAEKLPDEDEEIERELEQLPFRLHDRFCERWEIYALCFLLGLGEQSNKFEASKLLTERIIDIREKGAEIELCQIPDDSLNKMFKDYYGQKKIQISGGGKHQLFATRQNHRLQRVY